MGHSASYFTDIYDRDGIGLLVKMNPLKFVFGGSPYRLKIVLNADAASKEIEGRTADTVTDLVELFINTKRANHLLAGTVRGRECFLYVPRYLRFPVWPLSPVLRASLRDLPDGGALLEGRMRIRRWRAAAWLVACVLLLALPISGLIFAACFLIFWGALQFIFVLPGSARTLSDQVSNVFPIYTETSPPRLT